MMNNTFIQEIQTLFDSKNISYTECVILWAEKKSIELEVVAAWIKKDSTLKLKIQEEAESVNALKAIKPAKLSI